MRRRTYTNAIVVMAALSPLGFLFFVWNDIPEVIRLRFNLSEPVQEEESKGALLLSSIVLSVVAAGVYLLLRNIRRFDPKVKEHTPVSGFQRLGVLVVIMLTILNYFFILTVLNSWEVSEKFIYIFSGLLFALLGNYMYNIKPNFFAGIRLPWTLSDETNWRLTHNLAGKLWFGGGAVLAILAFFLPESALRPMFIAILVLMILIPCVYSYRLFKAKH